jgi:hypothetical protein
MSKPATVGSLAEFLAGKTTDPPCACGQHPLAREENHAPDCREMRAYLREAQPRILAGLAGGGEWAMSDFKIPSPAELKQRTTTEEQRILCDLVDTATRVLTERWKPGSSVWIALPSGFYGRGVELRFKELMQKAGWLVVVRSDQRDGDALEISAL